MSDYRIDLEALTAIVEDNGRTKVMVLNSKGVPLDILLNILITATHVTVMLPKGEMARTLEAQMLETKLRYPPGPWRAWTLERLDLPTVVANTLRNAGYRTLNYLVDNSAVTFRNYVEPWLQYDRIRLGIMRAADPDWDGGVPTVPAAYGALRAIVNKALETLNLSLNPPRDTGETTLH